MNLEDITLAEVKANPAHAEFYRDENGRAMIELSTAGSKDTVRRKVTPSDMANYKQPWDAFCDGRPLEKRTGTPLTDVPGIDQATTQDLIHRNVHTAEELAALSDGQCQAIGHGTLTRRESARKLLADRRAEIQVRAMKSIGKPNSEQPAADNSGDIAELKEQVSALSDNVGKLVQLMLAQQQAPKRGRPPKQKDD